VPALASARLRPAALRAPAASRPAPAPAARPLPAHLATLAPHLVAHFGLTDREAEVALLMADGLANGEIADLLYISRHTVRHHVENVLGKLGVTRRAAVLPAVGADAPVALALPTAEGVRARHGLSRREAEVALLMADGLANAEIADRLFISLHTVRRHAEAVLAKLEVAGRAAVRPALLDGAAPAPAPAAPRPFSFFPLAAAA
jgi:DNA-binding CsgD family transcriptional regulator